jgi:hypothetical protein
MEIIKNEYKKDLKKLGFSDEYISNLENGKPPYKSVESTISVATLIFYDSINIKTYDPKFGNFNFEGKITGFNAPGGGCGFGVLYIFDDLLFSLKTINFSMIFTSIYTIVVFFDKHNNILGHGQYGCFGNNKSIDFSCKSKQGIGSGNWSYGDNLGNVTSVISGISNIDRETVVGKKTSTAAV